MGKELKDLNELRDRAYKTACEHGFHDEEHSDEHLLCLVISELMEAVQADRKGKKSNKKVFDNTIKANNEYFRKDEIPIKFRITYDIYIKGSVEEELADAAIRILDIAGLRKYDIIIDDYPTLVFKNRTFTENIYYITRILMDAYYRCYPKAIVNYSLSQIFILANILNIDLMWHIEEKMRYNELREYKHGCKY